MSSATTEYFLTDIPLQQKVIRDYTPPPNMHVKYVSITEGFQTFRFCESGVSFVDNYGSDKVRLWNLLQENDTTRAVTGEVLTMPNNGKMMMLRQDALDVIRANKGLPVFSPAANELANGWMMRVFHPKTAGHTAIKDAIIKQIRADKVPGTR
jgi:hypothetical protein